MNECPILIIHGHLGAAPAVDHLDVVVHPHIPYGVWRLYKRVSLPFKIQQRRPKGAPGELGCLQLTT